MMLPVMIVALLAWLTVRSTNPYTPLLALLLALPYAYWCHRVWVNYQRAKLRGWQVTFGDMMSRGNRLRLFPIIPERQEAEKMEGFVSSRDELSNLIGVTMREPYSDYVKRVLRKE